MRPSAFLQERTPLRARNLARAASTAARDRCAAAALLGSASVASLGSSGATGWGAGTRCPPLNLLMSALVIFGVM